MAYRTRSYLWWMRTRPTLMLWLRQMAHFSDSGFRNNGRVLTGSRLGEIIAAATL